jgi:large subunit ribosomal protein L6e
MAHSPRNSFLKPGIARKSRSKTYGLHALYKKNKAAIAAAKPEGPKTITKTVGGAKNGNTRVVPAVKAPRFYPAEDAPVPKTNRKTVGTVTLRKSITPGTVFILLAGRFRGKRVVFLKQLSSGLLLVTGPYKVNGVPLRRVNQAYVVATSTKIELPAVAENIDDAFFQKKAEKKDAERVAAQKDVDAKILAVVKKTPLLKAYLNASFSLTKGQTVHNMKF